MTPEGKVVDHLKKRVRALGGLTRKVSWEGRIGAPDWLVMMNGQHCFIEAKSPTGKPTTIQLREHERMRTVGGLRVAIVHSPSEVDQVLKELENGNCSSK